MSRGNHDAVEALIEIGCHVSMTIGDDEPTPSFATAGKTIRLPNPAHFVPRFTEGKINSRKPWVLANVNINETTLLECLKPPAEEKIEDLKLEDIDWPLEFATFFKEKAEMPKRADFFYLKNLLEKHEGKELDYFKKVHEDFQIELPEKFSRLDKKLRGIDIINRPLTKRQRRRKKRGK